MGRTFPVSCQTSQLNGVFFFFLTSFVFPLPALLISWTEPNFQDLGFGFVLSQSVCVNFLLVLLQCRIQNDFLQRIDCIPYSKRVFHILNIGNQIGEYISKTWTLWPVLSLSWYPLFCSLEMNWEAPMHWKRHRAQHMISAYGLHDLVEGSPNNKVSFDVKC